MEERMVFEAAVEGSVTSLVRLLEEDPLILDRIIVNCFNIDTPLHIAALLGHTHFVMKILSRKPELAREVNSRRSSPLHLASAKGYVEIVRVLLSINSDMCLARDRDGRNPLHLAAMKGQVDVLKELLKARPEAARVRVGCCGPTILHLCVNHNQLEALKLLMETLGSDPEFVNSKDDDGNTILHLAVADKQIETINYLRSSSRIEVNAVNENGFTADDILARSGRDLKDKSMIKSLTSGGGALSEFGNKITSTGLGCDTDCSSPYPAPKKVRKNKKKYWLEEMRSALMVVASLIATMAFQAGVNPPGGVWQDDDSKNCQGNSSNSASNKCHGAGYSIWATRNISSYNEFMGNISPSNEFMGLNTVGFTASLSIILLLISGLPFRRKFFIWILMVIMWVAISAMVAAYFMSIVSLTPDLEKTLLQRPIWSLTPDLKKTLRQRLIRSPALIIVAVWILLIVFLLLAHTIRLLFHMTRLLLKIIKKLIKLVTVKRKRSPSTSRPTMMNPSSTV